MAYKSSRKTDAPSHNQSFVPSDTFQQSLRIFQYRRRKAGTAVAYVFAVIEHLMQCRACDGASCDENGLDAVVLHISSSEGYVLRTGPLWPGPHNGPGTVSLTATTSTLGLMLKSIAPKACRQRICLAARCFAGATQAGSHGYPCDDLSTRSPLVEKRQ